jgi:hypothetical protein
MQKRLAVTIAGAVSLGSYEAGVLYEVIDAITQHNSDPRTALDNQIVVDVLTGASAGGMTAIILAHKLMFCAPEFRGPYDNPLYNTWVSRITLAGLQDPARDEPALHSVFSSDLIEAISREAITDRYKPHPHPPAVKHPIVPPSLGVGVAITNLNGVAYGYPIEPAGQFVYLDYVDQLTRQVLFDLTDTSEFWEPLRQAAVACGAFPIAFRAQNLHRSAKTESDDFPPENREPWHNDPQEFTYSDGGVLQNQPLGIAKNLVDLIDEHLAQESRYYLFVSPHAKDPKADVGFHQKNADYFGLLKRLAYVVVGQASFQDWITAKGVNERISLLDQRAAGLKNAIKSGAIKTDALQETATAVLSLFFPGGMHQPPGAKAPETLPSALARIGHQYESEIADLGGTTPAAIAFRDAVLGFETAAGLGARDCMTIYGITATDGELAGAGMQSFLGFFDQEFRDHDYDTGRIHAHAVLTNKNLGDPAALGPINYTPKPIHPIDHSLDGLKMSKAPAQDLKAFRRGMRKRVNQMLREGMGPLGALPFYAPADILLRGILTKVIDES